MIMAAKPLKRRFVCLYIENEHLQVSLPVPNVGIISLFQERKLQPHMLNVLTAIRDNLFIPKIVWLEVSWL